MGQKKIFNKNIEKGETSRNIMLLEDNLNDILMNFDMNFTSEPKNILKKAATDERMIHHNNLFFKTDDTIIKNFDFLKKIWYIAWFIKWFT